MDPFVTPEQFSTWTQGKILANDPRLEDLLDGASAAIRRYCGWHVAPEVTDTLTLDGPGGQVLVLPSLHVSAVSAVVENGTTLTDGTDYEWSANGEIRRLGRHGWTPRWRAITVTLTHGYESAPDVAQVVMQACASALSSPMGATREQAGQLSVSWATTAPGVSGGLSLLQRDLDILNLYRLPKGA